MDKSFAFSLRKSLYKIKRSEIETFFINAEERIRILEDYAFKTKDLFNKQFEDELKRDHEFYEEQKSKVEEIYEKEYNNIYGNDEDRHTYDSWSSGLDSLEANQHENEVNLRRAYENMNDVFNKSYLTIVYSFIESQLYDLCFLCEKNFGAKSLNAFKRASKGDSYIEVYIKYLEEEARINGQLFGRYKTRIVEFKKIRNIIVHNNGRLTPTQIEEIKPYTSGKTNLKIEKTEFGEILAIEKVEYTLGHISYIRELLQDLIWALDKKLSYKILTKNLEFLLDYPDFESKPKILKVNNVKQNESIDFLFKVRDIGYECKIILEPNEENSLQLINQTQGSSEINKLFDWLKESNRIVFEEVLKPFFLQKKRIEVCFTVFQEV